MSSANSIPGNTPPANSRPAEAFSLAELFYAITLFAASLAAIGAWGALAAGLTLGFWGYIFHIAPTRPLGLRNAVLAIGIGFLCWYLWPRVQQTGPMVVRDHCVSRLREIALALHRYRHVHNKFPPSCVRDAEGKPVHSWRIFSNYSPP